MSERFYSRESLAIGPASLKGDEALHLARVMRAQVGDEVIMFDGSGAEFVARVGAIGRGRVELDVRERREIDRELRVRLTLAVALPRGERQRWLVEKATELGVAELVPIITERGVARPGDNAIERMRRAVIEASKQCGRNRLMKISPPVDVCESWTSAPREALRWIAHPSVETHSSHTIAERLNAARGADHVIAAIGPEGGFAPREVEAALSAGWRLIDLGRRTLRVETAAAMIAAIVGTLE
jgi:16S rRNA (uracil1498-N3)-methyltransferase